MSSVPDRLLRQLIRLASAWLVLSALGLVVVEGAAGAKPPGAVLLSEVHSGQRNCSGLNPGDFLRIGRYDMGRIMGSAASYQAMDAQLRASVGPREAQLAYRFIGERLSGCATGNGPVAFGTLMGMMGTSELLASYGSAYPSGNDGASMMVGAQPASGGVSTADITVIVFGGLVLVALIVWLATRRTPRPPLLPRT